MISNQIKDIFSPPAWQFVNAKKTGRGQAFFSEQGFKPGAGFPFICSDIAGLRAYS